MNFKDPFDWGNPGGLGRWPRPLQGGFRPNPPQGPESAPPEDAPTPDMLKANTYPEETGKKAPPATLSEPAWIKPDTSFHDEAEVTVKLSLPEGKEHLTRVQVELFAKTPNGPESIYKGEGHAKADGAAVVILPVYKPRNHNGDPVEYFFQVTHSLAEMLTGEKTSRKVSDTALKSADHALVSGTVFEKDSSFIPPQGAKALQTVEQKFQEWEKKHPQKSQIVVYGHADKDEKDAKALSERRAQSAYAFITNDAATWEKLYGLEKWGLKALQALLKELNHYHYIVEGKDGPKTQEAFKAFQKEAGLPETGQEDATTRTALFAAYMESKRDVEIDASRFRKVAGNPWMGCAAHNQIKEGMEAAPENRRVAFVLITPSKHFPVHFPCRDRSEAACRGQCEKAGKRSALGIKCTFYNELVREGIQKPASESSKADEKPGAFERISFDGYEGKGYVIKDFKKYQGCAIQLNPEKVSPAGVDLPDGFNNQCVSFARYFGLPQTSDWKKGPRVCDLKPGELPEGTVVATLRDGLYHSDNSGRSHAGIYLAHDDYGEYSKSGSDTAGVKIMDQWKGASIDSRLKKYSVNAEKETNKKMAWTDIDGGKHENRANWINDGEEYYVVLTQ
jgi:outer membrane protein OmpA-like peptidoglycan-associated protein